jgi:hypothetical protein
LHNTFYQIDNSSSRFLFCYFFLFENVKLWTTVNTDRGDLSLSPGLKAYGQIQSPVGFSEHAPNRNSGSRPIIKGSEVVQKCWLETYCSNKTKKKMGHCYFGIDVSKKKLDIVLLQAGVVILRQVIGNTRESIQGFFGPYAKQFRLAGGEAWVCMEHTGIYNLTLLSALGGLNMRTHADQKITGHGARQDRHGGCIAHRTVRL